MSDEDGSLRLSLHIYDGSDAVHALFLLIALHGHFAAVGYLFLVVEQEFLADNLADEKAHGAVGEFVFREIGRVFGQNLHDVVEDGVDVEPLGGGGRNDHGTGNDVLPIVYLLGDLLLVREVNLVDDKDDGRVGEDNLGKKLLVLQGLAHLGDQQEKVGVLQCVVHHTHHLLMQLVVGVDNAGGVGVDDLEILAVDDAHDAVACGLGLAGDDAEPLAHQGVHEGRLAHIGVADDVYESCFMHGDDR